MKLIFIKTFTNQESPLFCYFYLLIIKGRGKETDKHLTVGEVKRSKKASEQETKEKKEYIQNTMSPTMKGALYLLQRCTWKLHPLMSNRFSAVKCSRPGISSTIPQLVRLSSCNIVSSERSDILSNEQQFARFSFSKLHGREGRHVSSWQSHNESSLRLDNPLRLEGRL